MFKDGKLVNREIRIENTNSCNAHCVICPREKLTRPIVTMCWGHFCGLIDQSVKLGAKAVSIFGYGEPLMDKNLSEKVAYATERGLETHITTNASILTPRITHSLLDAGLKHIRFSIHGTSPLRYEAVHRRLSWLPVWRNFANFLFLNDHKGRPCKVHLTVIPMHNESVQEIRLTWEKWVDYLEVWRPHNWVYGRTFRRSQAKKKTCGRPFGGPIQILADGKMVVCCFDFDGLMVIGDTNEKEIADILSDTPLGLIQAAHRQGKHSGLPCLTCDQLNEDTDDVLLYSSRDPERRLGMTSTCKIKVANG